jgi:hypothetical protein
VNCINEACHLLFISVWSLSRKKESMLFYQVWRDRSLAPGGTTGIEKRATQQQ